MLQTEQAQALGVLMMIGIDRFVKEGPKKKKKGPLVRTHSEQ